MNYQEMKEYHIFEAKLHDFKNGKNIGLLHTSFQIDDIHFCFLHHFQDKLKMHGTSLRIGTEKYYKIDLLDFNDLHKN